MRVIRIGVDDWLVIDDAYRPVALIHHGPELYRPTRETLVVYRVDRWALRRQDRRVLGRFEYLEQATDRVAELLRPRTDVPGSWLARDGSGPPDPDDATGPPAVTD